MTSGYYDEFVGATVTRQVGGWELEYGQLPDGRWAVDYYSAAAPRKQRHYFDQEHEAEKEFEHFGSKTAKSAADPA